MKLVLSTIVTQLEAYIAKLAGPVSPATKAGVTVGVIFILTYVAVFHVESPVERTMLLTSTLAALVAGYALGAKS